MKPADIFAHADPDELTGAMAHACNGCAEKVALAIIEPVAPGAAVNLA